VKWKREAIDWSTSSGKKLPWDEGGSCHGLKAVKWWLAPELVFAIWLVRPVCKLSISNTLVTLNQCQPPTTTSQQTSTSHQPLGCSFVSFFPFVGEVVVARFVCHNRVFVRWNCVRVFLSKKKFICYHPTFVSVYLFFGQNRISLTIQLIKLFIFLPSTVWWSVSLTWTLSGVMESTCQQPPSILSSLFPLVSFPSLSSSPLSLRRRRPLAATIYRRSSWRRGRLQPPASPPPLTPSRWELESLLEFPFFAGQEPS
jgi:hypothetical protein